MFVETEPCRVPKLPALVLNAEECAADRVCISVAEANALSEWIFKVEEYRMAVRRCPLVSND